MKYILIITALYFSSCTNVSYNQLSGNLDVNITANLNADITVGDDISGSGSETVILWFLFIIIVGATNK